LRKAPHDAKRIALIVGFQSHEKFPLRWRSSAASTDGQWKSFRRPIRTTGNFPFRCQVNAVRREIGSRASSAFSSIDPASLDAAG